MNEVSNKRDRGCSTSSDMVRRDSESLADPENPSRPIHQRKQLHLSSHYHSVEEESFIPDGYKALAEDEFKSQYELSENPIALGRATVIKLAKNIQTGELYACKIIDKRLVPRIEQLHDEIRILASVHHKNIVSLHAMAEIANKLLLIVDLAVGGDLYERFTARKQRYTEAEVGKVIASLLSAASHLHKRGIIHRDIKPENILMTSETSDTDVKLTDFGAAKICAGNVNEATHEIFESSTDINSGDLATVDEKTGVGLPASLSKSRQKPNRLPFFTRLRAYTSIGTNNYNAPEVLMGEGYGVAVDAYSIGVVGYVLLFNGLPFQNTQAMFSSKTVTFPSPIADEVSEQAKHLLAGLLAVDPNTRLTCEDALQNPWILPYSTDETNEES